MSVKIRSISSVAYAEICYSVVLTGHLQSKAIPGNIRNIPAANGLVIHLESTVAVDRVCYSGACQFFPCGCNEGINIAYYNSVVLNGIWLFADIFAKDILELIIKSKPENKILPVSDCLPISYSDKTQMNFCNKPVYYDGVKITSAEGTLAGSALLLDDILRKLYKNGIDGFKYIKNLYEYHGLEINGYVYWRNNDEIVAIEKGDNVLYKE